MMIWKYGIRIGGFSVEMPKGAQILYVHEQDGEPYFWALVEPCAETELRAFFVAGTGQQIAEQARYIGSFMLHSGRFVGHLFEEAKWK